MMNDMKKNLDFIDKTNWMFTQDNFDIHFLNNIDPKTIDDDPSYFNYDINNLKSDL